MKYYRKYEKKKIVPGATTKMYIKSCLLLFFIIDFFTYIVTDRIKRFA